MTYYRIVRTKTKTVVQKLWVESFPWEFTTAVIEDNTVKMLRDKVERIFIVNDTVKIITKKGDSFIIPRAELTPFEALKPEDVELAEKIRKLEEGIEGFMGDRKTPVTVTVTLQ